MKLDDLAEAAVNAGITEPFDPSRLGYSKEELEREIHCMLSHIMQGARMPVELLRSRLDAAKLAGAEPSKRDIDALQARTRLLVDYETKNTLTGNRFMDEFVRSGGTAAHRYGERITVPLTPGSPADALSKAFAAVTEDRENTVAARAAHRKQETEEPEL